MVLRIENQEKHATRKEKRRGCGLHIGTTVCENVSFVVLSEERVTKIRIKLE